MCAAAGVQVRRCAFGVQCSATGAYLMHLLLTRFISYDSNSGFSVLFKGIFSCSEKDGEDLPKSFWTKKNVFFY